MNKFYIMFDGNRATEDKDVIRINKTYSVKLVEGYTYRTPEFDKKSFCFNVWNHGGTWQAVSLNGLLICTAKSRKDVIAKVGAQLTKNYSVIEIVKYEKEIEA